MRRQDFNGGWEEGLAGVRRLWTLGYNVVEGGVGLRGIHHQVVVTVFDSSVHVDRAGWMLRPWSVMARWGNLQESCPISNECNFFETKKARFKRARIDL